MNSSSDRFLFFLEKKTNTRIYIYLCGINENDDTDFVKKRLRKLLYILQFDMCVCVCVSVYLYVCACVCRRGELVVQGHVCSLGRLFK